MPKSKGTGSIEQSLRGLSLQIDQMQADLEQEVKKQHERFEAQIQEQVTAHIALVFKGIGDRMDRLEDTVKGLSKLQVSSDKPNANKEIGKIGEVLVRNADNEEIEVNQSEGRNQCCGKQEHRGYLPELPFPAFDVTNLANWVWKCDTYFDLYQIAEYHKTLLAVLHFNDTATTWYIGEKGNGEHLSWDVLKKKLVKRFKDWKAINPVVGWRQLEQTGSVEEYIEDFHVAKAKLLIKIPDISDSESFFVGSFISGLKEEIRCMVNLFDSTTLQDAFYRAIHSEKIIKPTQNKTVPC